MPQRRCPRLLCRATTEERSLIMGKHRSNRRSRLVVMALAVAAALLPSAGAYSSGKVEAACDTMTPQHLQFTPQTSLPPYTVSGTQNADGSITVNLQATSDGDGFFEGFLLQARNSSNQRVGVFTGQPEVAQLLTCGYPGDAVSHNSEAKKPFISVLWQPQGYAGDVTFRATFVRNSPTFWTGVTSQGFVAASRAVALTDRPFFPPLTQQPGYPPSNLQPNNLPPSGFGPPVNPPTIVYGPPNNLPPGGFGPPVNPPPGGYIPPVNPPPSGYLPPVTIPPPTGYLPPH